MDSTTLFDAAMNEHAEYTSIVMAVRQLRRAMDRVAAKHSKAIAEETESKPKPFTRQVKDKAIKDLVSHYLTEMNLNGEF